MRRWYVSQATVVRLVASVPSLKGKSEAWKFRYSGRRMYIMDGSCIVKELMCSRNIGICELISNITKLRRCHRGFRLESRGCEIYSAASSSSPAVIW